jgi:hypothetical protein
MTLPHPNIESKPGQQLDPKELAELIRKIQQNFDALDRRRP